MKENKIIIRDWESKDEKAIFDLMSPYWKHLNSKQNWDWEFGRCPGGRALIKVAEHKDMLVGHYALLLMEMKCDNEIILSGKAEGSIVHEEYRGNSVKKFFPDDESPRVFNKLIQSLFISAEKSRIYLLWGFPNKIALKSQTRAGYDHIPIPLSVMILPLNVRRTLEFFLNKRVKNKILLKIIVNTGLLFYGIVFRFRRYSESKIDSEVRIRHIEKFDKGIKNFWESWSKNNNCLTIKRDIKYLNWRFIDNPVVKHQAIIVEKGEEIIGYIITKLSDNSGYLQGDIVDIMILDNHENELKMLVEYALKDFMEKDVDLVSTWVVKQNPYSKMYQKCYQKCGFLKFSKKIDMIIKTKLSESKQKYIKDLSNWYITMAFQEGTT